MNKKGNSSNFLKAMQLGWGLGFIIVTPMLVFTFLGLWLDKTLGTKPIITMFGIILGALGGIYSAVKEVKQINK